MKVAVMGTGGVGGYFGGLLARAGHEITFVARGPHLTAIQQQGGLRLESQNDGNFLAPGKGVKDTSQVGPQDLVLFTVKMYHNDSAIEATRAMVGPDTIVLTLQNGIDNGEILAEAIGASHVMIGSAYMEGRIKEPGLVTQGGPGTASFGESQVGITERGQRLLKVFKEANWRVELQENMPGMLWKKFAYLSSSAAMCAATNSVYEEIRSVQLVRKAIAEALEVGRASGAPIMDDSLEWSMTAMDNFPAQGRSSMAKDFTEGKPVELEGLTGAVIRLGRKHNRPTPTHDALYAILKPWALRNNSGQQKPPDGPEPR